MSGRHQWRGAVCAQASERQKAWWSPDSTPRQRRKARGGCNRCPAFRACDQERRRLGARAAGMWAGQFQPYLDDDGTGAAELEWLAMYALPSPAADMPGQLDLTQPAETVDDVLAQLSIFDMLDQLTGKQAS